MDEMNLQLLEEQEQAIRQLEVWKKFASLFIVGKYTMNKNTPYVNNTVIMFFFFH
jgi:hypothetical protein